MSAAPSGELIWENLERQVQSEETGQTALWTHLNETVNISNYRPTQAQGVVYRRLESQREGTYYMLNNPTTGTYLKLDEKDFYVWSLMDGTQTIKQLVVAYFSEFGSIAFGLITDLVAQLRAASFLTDPPADVYAEVTRQCQKGTAIHWGERIWRAFLQKEMAIGGVDGILTTLYHRIFWVFFSKPALLIYLPTLVAGLVLFFYTVQAGTYPLFHIAGKWYWGVLSFVVANIIVVIVHESAHAFTTKHYGRRVRRGGLLIYFGSPAFFVDTMDMWMEPKKSRIAVSGAGPYSGLLVGSICMFIIAGTGFSDMFLNSLIFKVAIWAFVFGALANLNPLLEWDGYFMLMDWLEIPMLRKRSMDFVRRNLLTKIVSRASFSREERIFAVFGVLALAYTVGMLVVALFFWQSRVSSVLEASGGWVFWVLVGLIAVVIGIPLALAMWALGYRAAYMAQVWVYRRFLMGQPGNQVMALVLAAGAAALPTLVLGASASNIYTAIASGLVLAIGLVFTLRVAPSYVGSRLQWLFLALPSLVGLLLVSQVLSPFEGSPGSIFNVVAHVIVPVALLFSAVYLSPTIMSFNRTVLQGGWGLLVSGIVFLGIGSLAALLTTDAGSGAYVHALDLLGYGVFTAGLFRLYHRLRFLRLGHPTGFISGAISDGERLSSAMRFLVDGALEQFAQIYGRRALRALESKFNTASALGTGWGLSIKNGRLTDTGQEVLLERSQVYAAALSRLFSITSSIAGRRFVERELRSLYRLMPWEEREIGDEHLFFRLDWMSGVHQAFATTRGSHVNLLRSAPLFVGLGQADLEAISDRLRSETHPRGKDIVKQGEPGRKFYIIESGTVEVWVRDEDGVETLEVELGRGDYFGERALLGDAPRAATCRSKTRVRVLSLEKEDFDMQVARRFRIAEDLDEAIQRAELLMAMPLFSEVTSPQIKIVASKLVDESYPAGTTIIRQGEVGDKFYVVKSGTVEVRRRAAGTEEESTVGRLGQGEYFGEIALLMKVPRTASVITETDVELLSLDTASFEEMMRDYLQSSRGLEQVSSRRMTQLRRAETLGYRTAL